MIDDSDTVVGVQAIAVFIKETVEGARNLILKGELPATWTSPYADDKVRSKKTLLRTWDIKRKGGQQ